MSASDSLQPAQYYHGTAHRFEPGELVTPEHEGTRRYPESSRDHVYFTTDRRRAAVYAGMRDDPQPEHSRDNRYSVYQVRPTGDYEPDPQHSGQVEGYDREPNYRSASPLRVVRRMPMTHQKIRDAEYWPRDLEAGS